jgi:serpin B
MMKQEELLYYMSDAECEAVSLPYEGCQVVMILLLPAPGRFDALEAGLTGDRLAEIVSAFSDHVVTLTMPRFGYQSEFNLTDDLSNMGMAVAFTPAADFSGMSPADLFIDGVYHNTTITVNERGTEAAAGSGGLPAIGVPPPATMTLDRPFLYLIQDATGTILFLGRVLDPTK